MTGEMRTLLARIGPIWASDIPSHMRTVIDAYTPLVAAAPKDGIRVTRDLRYGRRVFGVNNPAYGNSRERYSLDEV